MMSWKAGSAPYRSTQRFTRARHTARQDSLRGDSQLQGDRQWLGQDFKPTLNSKHPAWPQPTRLGAAMPGECRGHQEQALV